MDLIIGKHDMAEATIAERFFLPCHPPTSKLVLEDPSLRIKARRNPETAAIEGIADFERTKRRNIQRLPRKAILRPQ